MADAHPHTNRVRSSLFSGTAFGLMAGALVLAPITAAGDIFHSYTPFLLLRFWVMGFCVYGVVLARRAGSLRRAWQFVYIVIGLPFALVWGLEVEEWAIIDLASASLIGLSALFLRTEPPRPGAA